MQWHNLKHSIWVTSSRATKRGAPATTGFSKRESDDNDTFEQQDRVRSIDLLRGMSVLVMVLVHYMIYYGNEEAMKSALYLF
jgi:uncharacterized membrane protein